jgi:hypothetical protein
MVSNAVKSSVFNPQASCTSSRTIASSKKSVCLVIMIQMKKKNLKQLKEEIEAIKQKNKESENNITNSNRK